MNAATAASEDDLEALFDRIASERAASAGTATHRTAVDLVDPAAPAAGASAGAPAAGRDGSANDADTASDSTAMFRRIGALTRTLHAALCDLGFDRTLANAANTMPDARKRLEYIASLTGRSANTVLEGVERAQALQQSIDQSAGELGRRWHALYDGTLSADEFKVLAGDTREFLTGVCGKTAATQGHLHQMMMAQDFHDLTGQVIKTIVEVAHTVEASLVELLLETRPAGVVPVKLLRGPAIGPDASGATVLSQAQVDQLLESMGF